MAKPVLMTIDDDPAVLRAVERDLKSQYADKYRVLRAESGPAALDLLKQLKQRNDAVALLLRNDFAFLEATHATGAIGAYAVPLKESEFHSRLHLVATAN